MDTLYISWSMLRVFEECRQKAKLYKQHKKNPSDNQRVFFPGSVVDRACRNWLANDPENNPGGLAASITTIIQTEQDLIAKNGGQMRWKDEADKQVVEDMCIEAAKTLEPVLNKIVVPYDYQPAMRFKAPLMLKHPITGIMTEVILNGEMDILLQRPNGKFQVWDLKITRDANYWRKTVGQLTFYDLCVSVMFGEPPSITGLIQPLVKGVPVYPYAITDDIRSQMLTRISTFADALWRDDMPAKEETDYACKVCAVKHACTKFTPVIRGGYKLMNLGDF